MHFINKKTLLISIAFLFQYGREIVFFLYVRVSNHHTQPLIKIYTLCILTTKKIHKRRKVQFLRNNLDSAMPVYVFWWDINLGS